MRICLTIFLFFLNAVAAKAHVGSPNVFFEGKAGEYPLRVVIRPPDVVPGLAEISVRVESNAVQHVAVLPVYWRAGRNGAPPADEAKLVRGETNVYSAALWLMKPGSYSVEVSIDGARGRGTLAVPVNSVATNTRPMSRGMTWILCILGILLFLGGLQIARSAFTQSGLEPGAVVTAKDRWRGSLATAVAALILCGLIFGGKEWWDFEDRNYRNNSLYRPMSISAVVKTNHNQHILELEVDTSGRRGDWTPLLPDHGKMMHLFLVQDGKSGAFAHLHPIADDKTHFSTPVPPLPEGHYNLYADVTHESGFAETLTTTVKLPTTSVAMVLPWLPNSGEPICSPDVTKRLAKNLFFPPDPDDSWHWQPEAPESTRQDIPAEGRAVSVDGGYKLIWENPKTLIQNQDLSLRFRLLTPDNRPALIEPYMGMLGHAFVRHDEGTVFAHIHPAGTFSMAAQEAFANNELAPKTKAIESSTSELQTHQSHTNGIAEAISFPYAFPKPGPYRLWVQTKSEGRILTGVFNVSVAESANKVRN